MCGSRYKGRYVCIRCAIHGQAFRRFVNYEKTDPPAHQLACDTWENFPDNIQPVPRRVTVAASDTQPACDTLQWEGTVSGVTLHDKTTADVHVVFVFAYTEERVGTQMSAYHTTPDTNVPTASTDFMQDKSRYHESHVYRTRSTRTTKRASPGSCTWEMHDEDVRQCGGCSACTFVSAWKVMRVQLATDTCVACREGRAITAKMLHAERHAAALERHTGKPPTYEA
jgi:hypothetical protein